MVWWASSNNKRVCAAVEMRPLTHGRCKLICIQQPCSVTHFALYWISIALHTCPPLLLHTISAAHMRVIVSWEMWTEASSSQRTSRQQRGRALLRCHAWFYPWRMICLRCWYHYVYTAHNSTAIKLPKTTDAQIFVRAKERDSNLGLFLELGNRETNHTAENGLYT